MPMKELAYDYRARVHPGSPRWAMLLSWRCLCSCWSAILTGLRRLSGVCEGPALSS